MALVALGAITTGFWARSDQAAAATTTLYEQMNDGAWSVATNSNRWA